MDAIVSYCERMKCLVKKNVTGDPIRCDRWLRMIRFIGCLCLVSLVGIAYVSYQLCHSSSCLAPEKFHLTQSQQFHFSPQLKQAPPPPFPPISSQSKIETVPFDSIQNGDQFNIADRDVIVFLHIQKTGGKLSLNTYLFNLLFIYIFMFINYFYFRHYIRSPSGEGHELRRALHLSP